MNEYNVDVVDAEFSPETIEIGTNASSITRVSFR
jgi:hypothetical protein